MTLYNYLEFFQCSTLAFSLSKSFRIHGRGVEKFSALTIWKKVI